VFELLKEQCYLSLGQDADWVCETEVPTREGKGRLDIVLHRHGDDADARRRVLIESKVESPATLNQLRRYQQSQAKALVLVTKHRPEPGLRALRKYKIRHFRWQDLHDRLQRPGAPKGTGVNRFLCIEFAKYLEGQDMAYEKTISKKDVERLGRVLRTIGGPEKPRGITPRSGLDALLRWLNLTGEVAERLREEHPGLARARKWGPGYFSYLDDPNDTKYHAVGVVFSSRPWDDDHVFGFCLNVGSPKKVWFDVWLENGDDERDVEFTVASLCRKGRVDIDTVTKHVLKLAKRWKVRLK
jgi:hypothetical protein